MLNKRILEELLNISNLVTRIFKVNFKFLNKDVYKENEIRRRFEDDKLIFEDISGDPLSLFSLINLNNSFLTSSRRINDIAENKSVFNIQYARPWNPKDYYFYMKNLIYGNDNLNLVENECCLIGDKFEIRGFANSDKENHRKVLRVQNHNRCVLKSKNKVKVSELLPDPRFKDAFKNVEATYLFPCGKFTVKWEKCFNIFDWPDLNADCHIEINLCPETMFTSLEAFKLELHQLQVLFNAVDKDLSTWELVDPSNEITNVEQFNNQLLHVLNHKRTVKPSGDEIPEMLEVVPGGIRDTDTTEDLWTLFKNISTKALYKQCVNSIFPILQNDVSKVKLNPSNETQFYRMLIESYLKGDTKVASFMTSLMLLVEVGLRKITKDLISIISMVLPNLTQDDIMKIFKKCCLNGDLLKGIQCLNNFFNLHLFLEILRDLLHPHDFQKIALNHVMKFIASISNDADFDLHQVIDTKMSSINPKARCYSCLWIIYFASTQPILNEKAIIFEIEKKGEESNIYRHDIDLADAPIFDCP